MTIVVVKISFLLQQYNYTNTIHVYTENYIVIALEPANEYNSLTYPNAHQSLHLVRGGENRGGRKMRGGRGDTGARRSEVFLVLPPTK